MAEEEIIRKRLCVEGEGGSDDRRVLSLLKTFVRWVSGPNPNPSLSEEERERERDATYQKMLFTLGQCEFSFTKTELVMDMNRREMERYEQVYSDIGKQIEQSQLQIVQFKEELQKSRVIRRHRQEYDAMAKVIQQHPPRANTEERIVELQSQLSSLQESRQSLEKKLEQRRRQFHVLLTSIHNLQSLLSKEGEREDEGEREREKEEEEDSVTMDTT